MLTLHGTLVAFVVPAIVLAGIVEHETPKHTASVQCTDNEKQEISKINDEMHKCFSETIDAAIRTTPNSTTETQTTCNVAVDLEKKYTIPFLNASRCVTSDTKRLEAVIQTIKDLVNTTITFIVNDKVQNGHLATFEKNLMACANAKQEDIRQCVISSLGDKNLVKQTHSPFTFTDLYKINFENSTVGCAGARKLNKCISMTLTTDSDGNNVSCALLKTFFDSLFNVASKKYCHNAQVVSDVKGGASLTAVNSICSVAIGLLMLFSF